MSDIRNFCIIAHIDHGKSTLADRLLQITGTITEREMQEQMLDDMDLERERGITIKSHAIKLNYVRPNGEKYFFNLIDTPGHVDFAYEVSRALKACEGAILVVDATQGIEAQTISNLYQAIEQGLEIIPVLNKIDLPSSDPEGVGQQVVDLIGCKMEEILHVSGKTGEGVPELLEAIVERVPAPKEEVDKPLRALIFDSIFNTYRGSVAYVRVIEGVLRKGERFRFMANDMEYNAEDVGYLRMSYEPTQELRAGDVGYVIGSVKSLQDVRVGDTITHVKNGATVPIPGYQEAKPMVFSGIFPTQSEDFEDLRSALEKLQLNDASLTYEPETSKALGFGFRAGFLGLLHMEIVQERLDREFDIDIITTVPNVQYEVELEDKSKIRVDNPSQMPEVGEISTIYEPYIKANIITPAEYIGPIMKLCQERRGIYVNQMFMQNNRVEITYELPMAEVVFDFYDRLKSGTRGYASLDYEFIEYRPGQLVRLDILLNGDQVDALSSISHRDKAYYQGRKVCAKLKELIPRQQFEVAVQAAIGSRIIARDSVRALRKDVTAKCYGGDISRKRKLLEKQKEGKKRMKQVGAVEIPQEAFLAVLSMDDDDR
ncbi:MAG: elongation factor 4 [Rhodothermaeota bacterium MED-G12]|jgi:GTP-binding protein LepA|nr:elongation factor 4 [Balneolaceae bacterium]PDH54402.1 MAG: elongation factor 4 [Rhodothermaeota bacterium MED-G12]MBL6916191.1 elongation factor 4 [Balneolaceae bacterium]MDC0591856.1 translation elongation factor 4 [Balneolaceae bacterium]MDC3297159.1 translation elongation factor 4 [Balneolaceae bacterium]|tara:strand:+ start:5666 stop:7468 length:1803 start_codon:yes stop_codon:yes gene_type:complete